MQINLGFTPIKAVDLSKHLEQGEYSDHKTTLQWAQDSIESELKCNILLAGKPNYGITKPYNIAENLGDFEIPTDEEEDAVLVKAVDTFWVPLEELEPGSLGSITTGLRTGYLWTAPSTGSTTLTMKQPSTS